MQDMELAPQERARQQIYVRRVFAIGGLVGLTQEA